jgi:hypothetical protein
VGGKQLKQRFSHGLDAALHWGWPTTTATTILIVVVAISFFGLCCGFPRAGVISAAVHDGWHEHVARPLKGDKEEEEEDEEEEEEEEYDT